MDLDAILARRPEIVVVDEIAHTNAPGSRNKRALPGRARDPRRRHQRDRRVQHPAPREPERPRRAGDRRDDPRDRARQLPQAGRSGREPRPRGRGPARAAEGGKIYAADKIPWALENFFKNDKLATLRELALREVAESLDRTGTRNAAGRPRARRRARHRPHARARARARDGLHVVVPAARGGAAAPRVAPGRAAQHRLVRRLRRDARGGAAPASTPRRSGICSTNIERARELGAEVVRLQGSRRGRGAARLRALARRRPHRGRTLAQPLVAAAHSAARRSARMLQRGARSSTSTSSRVDEGPER